MGASERLIASPILAAGPYRNSCTATFSTQAQADSIVVSGIPQTLLPVSSPRRIFTD